MDTVPANFIPHDTAQAAPSSSRQSGLPEFLLLAAVVLLVASGALAGAVFVYAQYLQTANASKLQQLVRAKDAFDPATIQELGRLDDRMHAADAILGKHLAPSAFFNALSQATLSTVSFNDLALQASDPNHITVQMTGVAQSVNSIALQAEIFSKNGVITSPIFSGISRQQDGVHFNLTALINPSAVGYAHVESAAASAAQTVQQTPAQAQPSQQQGSSPFGTPSGGNQ